MKIFKETQTDIPYIGQLLHNKREMSEWDRLEVTLVVESIEYYGGRIDGINEKYGVWGDGGRSYWREINDK